MYFSEGISHKEESTAEKKTYNDYVGSSFAKTRTD